MILYSTRLSAWFRNLSGMDETSTQRGVDPAAQEGPEGDITDHPDAHRIGEQLA
jgi:hypothetical protein